jgi:hypothetical protein
MDLAVLVMSCDAFDDVWQPFFLLFQKYWADCPFPKYICTDAKPTKQEGFIDLTPGKNLAWSYRLKYALQQIPQRYVLFLQDDFFLIKNADNQRLIKYLQIIKQEQAGILRVFPIPAPDLPFKDYEDIGLVAKSVPYRVSCQAAIWDKEVLLQIINENENIWQFEIEGTKRSDEIEKPFLSVYEDKMGTPLEHGNYAYTYFCTAVLKGKWMRGAVKLCEQEGIVLDLERRRVETWWEENRRYLYDRTPKVLQKYMWFLLFRVLK